MIFDKNSRGGREVNMINTVSKIGVEEGGSTSIWIMSLNILFLFFLTAPQLGKFRPRIILFQSVEWGGWGWVAGESEVIKANTASN